MAKDDYFVIVSKILIYLYKKLKGNEKLDKNYITAGTQDFPISIEYLLSVIDMMGENGYIQGSNIIRAWGGDIIYYDLSNLKITEKGINHLSNDSNIRKVCDGLKEAISIMSLFL